MTLLAPIAILIWWAMPGVILARRLYGSQPGGWGAALLAGPAWGYALSSLMLLALWMAGVRTFWLLLAPVPAAVVVWPARRLGSLLTVPAITRREVAAWGFVVLAIVAIVGRPFANIGKEVPEGRAYRAYFTADFVWAMAVVAEVSKGDVPPKNPYYNDGSLHYYWLMHLLPAAEYHLAPNFFSILDVLRANALWAAITFGGFFYFFVRHFISRPWPAAIACVGALWCSSFEGFDRLLYVWRRTGSLEFDSTLDYLRGLNIDAVGNWMYQGMKIDGIHRLLLYQPQHQVGYMLGFSALLLLAQARDCSRALLLLLCGTFLGLSLLFSSFAGGIFLAMTGAYEGLRLIQARRWRAFVPCALALAAPFAMAVALGTALDYVDPINEGRLPLVIGLNPLAAYRVAWTFWLNFGPVLIVAAAGLAIALRRRTAPRLIPLLTALAVSTTFYFLVDVLDVQGAGGLCRPEHRENDVHRADATLCHRHRRALVGARVGSMDGNDRDSRSGAGRAAHGPDRRLQHAGRMDAGNGSRLSMDGGSQPRGDRRAELDQGFHGKGCPRSGRTRAPWPRHVGVYHGLRRTAHGRRDSAGHGSAGQVRNDQRPGQGRDLRSHICPDHTRALGRLLH
jgi:hypothetical protein